MPNITIVNGSYCHLDEVATSFLEKEDWTSLTTQAVINDAVTRSGMAESKIAAVFQTKSSLLERITHDKDLAAAWVKLSVAHLIQKENTLITGAAGLLVPDDISHVLRVCVISNLADRIKRAMAKENINASKARKKIEQDDLDLAQWCLRVTGKPDPWDPGLYDMFLPIEQGTLKETADQIHARIQEVMLQETTESRQKAKDFLLEAEVGLALSQKGHHMEVYSERGKVDITVNEHTLRFDSLAEKLTQIAKCVDGVYSVSVIRGEAFHKADIISKQDFKMPTKVLLVDDERKFVKMLSNRLVMRDLGATVAYDGYSALEMIEKDKPEVMVLDLKMPGMDGIEVLQKVRKEHPDVAVVILTGHGTELERQTCLELGAVDYLHKPVKIEVLSQVLEKAVQKKKASEE